jgi:hypothetical protein
MGGEINLHRLILTADMEGDHRVLSQRHGDQYDHLHHERDGNAEPGHFRSKGVTI